MSSLAVEFLLWESGAGTLFVAFIEVGAVFIAFYLALGFFLGWWFRCRHFLVVKILWRGIWRRVRVLDLESYK